MKLMDLQVENLEQRVAPGGLDIGVGTGISIGIGVGVGVGVGTGTGTDGTDGD